MAEGWRGHIGGMDEDRMNLFLAGDVIARLAVLDDDGRPYVNPVWYHWDGDAFWFVIRERSAIGRYMAARPGVGLVIDTVSMDPPDAARFDMPKVVAQGNAEVVEEPNVGGQWVGTAQKMAVRYLGPKGPEYITGTLQQPRWLFKVVPDSIKTWEGVGWAKRYWVESEEGPTYDEVHSAR